MRADRWQRRRPKPNQRGVALVMVMLATIVLTIFLADLQHESTTAFSAAITERERLKAEYHARSAVNLARLLISAEPLVRKAVAPMFALINPKGKAPQIPIWEFSAEVLGAFNDAMGAEAFQGLASVDPKTGEKLGLGAPGRFEVVIVDEDAKLNVNTAARSDPLSKLNLSIQLVGLFASPEYDPLFQQLDTDGQHSDRRTICSAIIDWADSDAELEPCDPSAGGPASGSEDNFYQTIGLGYFRKNAAFDSLEELRMVRGVGDDFWATFVDPEPRDPRKRVMTVWGQGKINVNTVNAQTLLALVCGNAVPETELCLDPLQAAAFMSTVSLVRSFTAGAPLFGSPGEFITTMKGQGMVGPWLAMAGVKPVVFKNDTAVKSMISTESKMFSIYAEGIVPGRERETRVGVHAVVDFRKAASPSQVLPGGLAGNVTGDLPPGQKPGGASGGAGSAEAAGAEAILSALHSNPAGQIVYFRIQ
jgi:general secretion pathway protein K